MDCRNFEELSSLYIDNMLSKEEAASFEAHLENCEECNMKLKNLQLIVESMNEIDEIELPDNFTASLREKLQEIEVKPKKKKWQNWKVFSAVAAGLLVTVLTASLLNQDDFKMRNDEPSTQNYSLNQHDDSARVRGEEAEMAENAIPQESAKEKALTFNKNADLSGGSLESQEMTIMKNTVDSRKLIEQGNILLETENFDQIYESITELVSASNGYIQRSESYYRLLNREKPDESLKNAYLSIRVPNDRFKDVFEQLKALGVVINQNINVEDVTITYHDMENEALNLEVQEERLREILQKADKVEDILQIENELNRIRTQINNNKTALRNYDQLIALSTIDVQIEEVQESSAKIQASNSGLWSMARNHFIQSINQIIYFGEILFIKLFGMIPVMVVITIVGVPIGLIIYKIRRRRN